MKLEKTTEELYTLLKIWEDKLDSRFAPDLKNEFVALKELGVRYVVLNLEQVNHVDSSGLSAFLIGNRTCGELNGALVLCSLSKGVSNLIKISQLDKVLNILPTQQEAIEAVFMDEMERQLEEEGDGNVESKEAS
ncbi:MAG: STAS domain-containing protein [Bacteroidia bacterium]